MHLVFRRETMKKLIMTTVLATSLVFTSTLNAQFGLIWGCDNSDSQWCAAYNNLDGCGWCIDGSGDEEGGNCGGQGTFLAGFCTSMQF
jgi:hypothetical protein